MSQKDSKKEDQYSFEHYLAKVKNNGGCSVAMAEAMTAALNRKGILPADLMLRFRPLHGDFDIVNRSYMEHSGGSVAYEGWYHQPVSDPDKILDMCFTVAVNYWRAQANKKHEGLGETQDGAQTIRGKLLDKAKGLVDGHRQEDYGSPVDNFTVVSNLWNAYLQGRGPDLNAQDVAIMLLLLKVGRVATGAGTEDTYLDMMGYAAIAGECFLSDIK